MTLPDGQRCAAPPRAARREEVAAVCNYWSLHILDLLASGPCQYEYFLRELSIARNILAARLVGLRSLGLIDRNQCTEDQRRFFYRLTTRGREFLPVISALRVWSGWDGSQEGEAGITKLGIANSTRQVRAKARSDFQGEAPTVPPVASR